MRTLKITLKANYNMDIKEIIYERNNAENTG